MLSCLRFPQFVLVSLVLLSTVAHAQTRPAGDGGSSQPASPSAPHTPALPIVREHVVVTATGRETRESTVGASLTVVDGRQIEQRHALSTIDLLRSVPGVIASRPGGVGNLTSLWVRGGESTYNKVLLDGMPLNEPGGTFNFASIAPENIERIEVLRGAHSALFGSDAMASVIQLFSKRSESARHQADVTVDAGTYNTGHLAAGAGKRGDRLEYRGFASHLATDNRAPNNEHRNTTLSASLGAELRPGAALRAFARGDFASTGVPGQTAFGRPDLDAHSKHANGNLLVGWNQAIGARLVQRASYSLTRARQESVNLTADPSYTPQFRDRRAPFAFSDFLYHSTSLMRRHHLAYRADVALPANQTVTAAFAYDGERAVLTNHLSADTPQRPGRDNTGTTVQYEKLAGPVSLVTGVRFEHNGSFGFYAAPRASASWLAARGSGAVGSTRLHASAGLGIKEPTFLQSYSPNPGFRGNPDLDPERSRGFDVGIEQRFTRDRLSVDFTYFANHFDDLISLGPFDPVTFDARYENIGETRAGGVELAVSAVVHRSFQVRGYYSLLDSKVIRSTSSSPIFAPGRPLLRRPRHSGSVEGSFTTGRLGIAAGAIFVGERADTDSALLGLMSNDGYATLTATVDWRLGSRTSAFVTGDNLANRDFMDPLGYPALGRTVRGGIRARL